MHSTIAVGISSTSPSGEAVRWAVRRAAGTDADIVLVHVVGETEAPGTDDPGRAEDARRLLDGELRAARAFSPDSRLRLRTLQGSVMWQLVAASGEFDLIVVGTHKTGFIHGSVYGSTSLPLASEAACPVVVVPAPTRADLEGVVVGADESAAGRAAVVFAATEALETDQLLTIVRVDAGGADSSGADSSGADSGVERLLRRLRALAGGRAPGVRVRGVHAGGSPAPALVAAAAGSRLLVLGDARTSALEPLALGTVCHDALLNIRVPTAIVHAGDTEAAHDDAAHADHTSGTARTDDLRERSVVARG